MMINNLRSFIIIVIVIMATISSCSEDENNISEGKGHQTNSPLDVPEKGRNLEIDKE